LKGLNRGVSIEFARTPFSITVIIKKVLTFAFVILAGVYARWIRLEERISPVQFVELVEKPTAHALETNRIVGCVSAHSKAERRLADPENRLSRY
jgi:hypothetical protein